MNRALIFILKLISKFNLLKKLNFLKIKNTVNSIK